MKTLLYRNTRLLFLVLSVIVALAILAINSIGRQEDPSITGIYATIVTPYPGAEPARVEALVTEKVEEKLREIPEIEDINSLSKSGVSVVSVELSIYLPHDEIEQVWSELRDAVAEAYNNFPSGVPEPQIDIDRFGAFTTISAIGMNGSVPVNPALQRRYAELLQDQLRQVPDTKLVRIYGDQEEEIRISVEPEWMASLGITMDDIANLSRAADVKVPAGQLYGNSLTLPLEVDGEIDSLQRVRNIPITSDENGSILRLGDIARIERVTADPPRELAYANGHQVVLVGAQIESDRRVDVWITDVYKTLQSFEAELPAGLSHELLFDQSKYTAERFVTLGKNMLIGIALVVLVLFVSLGWRSAVVVASIIPLATMGTLIIMNALGLEIQQMSITGLIVALGLLVDAAVVMSDEIKRRIQDGLSALEAVRDSVGRLTIPLLASTVTTILAYVPMSLLPGPPGDFVGSIAMSVMIMLAVSFILAVTVAPAIAGKLMAKGQREATAFWQTGISLPRLGRAFDASIRLALEHKGPAIVGSLVLPIMGFLVFPTLTAQFFPGVERDQLYIEVKMPGDTAFATTKSLVQRMDATLQQEEDIKRSFWVVGESAPSFYYNMKMNQDGVPSYAEALITTVSPEATERLIPALQDQLDKDYPEAQILVRGLVQGPPVDAPVEIRLFGTDLEVLRQYGETVRQSMSNVPEITHTRANLSGADPKLQFKLDEEKVRLAGLTLGDVARQIDTNLSGTVGGSLVEASEELNLRFRVGQTKRDSTYDLRSMLIIPLHTSTATQNGQDLTAIPLSALGTLNLQPSDSPIARRNGERVNTVQGFIKQSTLPEESLKQVMANLDAVNFKLPPGYRLELGGDSDARAETAANLAKSAGLVIILTIITIFLTYGSYRLSIITLLVAGLSMGLSLLSLAIFQYPFGINALIGTIGSIGVSVNAGIIILTGLQADENAMQGDPKAIRGVVNRSSRHILSTTLTTVGGFTPLIIGAGSFWPPFAMAIAGGVFLSMVISFYFTPVMFALTLSKKHAAADGAQQRSAEFQDKEQISIMAAAE
ncbi:efflux RND transporter permease subunit [Pseudovibrio axinellae]|nr:efflux RND transporter permease subunit [Pseudovibrio axinellae]